jgi:ADP-heptose:LPS heptosyltransferase
MMFLRNVLIFHAGALGDFVQAWPLGLALGRLYPQSRVIYVTQRQKGLLAEKALRLEFANVESGWHHLFGDATRLPEICRSKLALAHSIFSFIAKPGDGWMNAVASIAPHAQVTGISTGAWHQILESMNTLPAVQAAMSQILASIADRGIGLSRPTETGPIAIHPGSGSPDKCWPIDSFLALIDRLHAAGHRCRILLGEVELERWSAEQIHRLQSAEETVHPATYVDLLRELSGCSAFVGNDSGPGHLAGIIGLPSVILFGPTDPAIWKPVGPRVRAFRADPLTSLPVDRVFQELSSGLPQTLSPVRAD